MAISAKEKLINAIYDSIGVGNITNTRKLDGMEEIDAIFKDALSRLRQAKGDYKYIKESAKTISMQGIEYTCSNGVILVEATIEYEERGKKHESRQIIVTNDYRSIPLIYITTDYRKRAIQQLFSKTEPSDDIYKEQEKIIEIQDVNICFDGISIGNYQTLTNLKTNSVMNERCIQHYLLGNHKEKNELLKACSIDAKLLEILYENNEPIYAQFANHSSVEDYDYDSKKDAKKIEDEVKQEVDAIAVEISRIISSQNKKTAQYIKIDKKEI